MFTGSSFVEFSSPVFVDFPVKLTCRWAKNGDADVTWYRSKGQEQEKLKTENQDCKEKSCFAVFNILSAKIPDSAKYYCVVSTTKFYEAKTLNVTGNHFIIPLKKVLYC